MGGGVVEQEGAGQDFSGHGIDLDVLTFGHVQRQAANGRDSKGSIGVETADHRAEGVGMGGDRQPGGRAHRTTHRSLVAQLRFVAITAQDLGGVLAGLLSEAGGRVDLYEVFQSLK